MIINTSGKDIVARIDKLCESHSIKRKQLADAIGINPSTIAVWSIRNTVPSADIAIAIARFFRVNVEWLITGEDPNSKVPPPMTFDNFLSCLEQLRKNYEK